jgi:maltose-binding protein MalE
MKTIIKTTVFIMLAFFLATNSVSAQNQPKNGQSEKQTITSDINSTEMLCACFKMIKNNKQTAEKIDCSLLSKVQQRLNSPQDNSVTDKKQNSLPDFCQDSVDEEIIP